MDDQTNIDLPPVALARVDVTQIMEMIPHRHPFLLIDRVEDVRLDHSCVGIKNVTFNEHFFQGHFPGKPVMPGVLIVEAMAQTAAIMVVTTMGEEARDPAVYFMSIEGAKFRKPVVPGDVLRMELKKDRRRGTVWRFTGEARVDGVVVAEATLTAMIIPGGNAKPE